MALQLDHLQSAYQVESVIWRLKAHRQELGRISYNTSCSMSSIGDVLSALYLKMSYTCDVAHEYSVKVLDGWSSGVVSAMQMVNAIFFGTVYKVYKTPRICQNMELFICRMSCS